MQTGKDEDVQGMIEAKPVAKLTLQALRSMSPTGKTFETEYGQSIEAISDRILHAEGLRHEKGVMMKGTRIAILGKDYLLNSQEHFADQILKKLRYVRRIRRQANHNLTECAIAELMVLVTQVSLKFEWESAAFAGLKHIAGGRKGADIKWGTEQVRKNKHSSYREAFEKEVSGGCSKTDAYKKVARLCGVSPRTVMRAVK